MKTTETGIYKTTYELSELVVRLSRHFPKDLKPAIGQRLIDTCVEMVVKVYRANAARKGRAEIVEQMLEDLQVVELLVRLCSDQHLISRKQHAQAAELTDSIGRQGYRWMQDAKHRQARHPVNSRHGQNG
jgi:hypothetical protein